MGDHFGLESALMLDVDDLRLHLGQSLDRPGDLPAETFWQGSTVPRHQRRRHQGLVARFDVDAANALAKQQAFDPVEVMQNQSNTGGRENPFGSGRFQARAFDWDPIRESH